MQTSAALSLPNLRLHSAHLW